MFRGKTGIERHIVVFAAAFSTIAALGVGSAAAQFTQDDRQRFLEFGRAQGFIGGEVRHTQTDVRIQTTFDQTGPGGVSTASVSRSESSVDPGFEAGIYVPLEGLNGGPFGSVWGAPTIEIDAAAAFTFGGGDTAAPRFSFRPNVASVFAGWQQTLFETVWSLNAVDQALLAITGRIYVGGRLMDYDLYVSGLAGGGYSFSNSGSEVVPAGGFDLGVDFDKSSYIDEEPGALNLRLYGGAQLQGGFDVTATGGNANAAVITQIDVDPTTTIYGGIALRRSF